jgi:hypothetical protein
MPLWAARNPIILTVIVVEVPAVRCGSSWGLVPIAIGAVGEGNPHTGAYVGWWV